MTNKKKVLIIDDDEAVLDVMKEALLYEGFEVKTSDEAEDITSLIDNYSPDLLLIDYILKGINGGEICHQVKVNPKTDKLPVIIVSAYPRVLTSLGYYGCDKFIPKPFDLSNLVGSINTVLNANEANAIPEHYF
ncbi:response regulator [Inquilinus sp. KBS0705]|nr:response regulator [Inquilinus sp. KBS0705]